MTDLFGKWPDAPLMVLPPQRKAPKPESKLLNLLDDAEMGALCAALSPERVTFASYSSAKRIAARVSKCAVTELTAKERNAAIRIAYRYRRQMPRAVLLLLKRFPAGTFKQ